MKNARKLGRRKAFSLLELLVVISIIGLMIGLLLAAISQIRVRAALLRDENAIKQIVLALHNYAALNNNELPGSNRASWISQDLHFANNSPLYNILPLIEHPGKIPYGSIDSNGNSMYDMVNLYISRNDPFLAGLSPDDFQKTTLGVSASNFSVNMQVFSDKPSMNFISDGLSNTIGISTHYFQTTNRLNRFTFIFINQTGTSITNRGLRSGTFADPSWDDAYPKSQGIGQFPVPTYPGTFQLRPLSDNTSLDSDGRFLQSLTNYGLTVGMMDGSVKLLGSSPNLVAETFW